MPDPALTEALLIALDYLKATGQAVGHDTEQLVAGAILSAWLKGTRHRIRLANAGIVAAQRAQSSSPETSSPKLDFLRERFFDC